MAYDAFNRLIQVKRKSTNLVIAVYTYDSAGRRIRKVITNGGLSGSITNGTTDYLYKTGKTQCVEERDVSDAPSKQYVWGMYIDELIQQRDDPDGTPADRYQLQDMLYRSRALTDDSGAIVEAYDMDVYGNTIIYDAAGTGSNWWAVDASTTEEPSSDFLYTGRRYDAESTNYYFRARYFSPNLGIFLSRDPAGYRISNFNLYRATFVPKTTDPSGRLELSWPPSTGIDWPLPPFSPSWPPSWWPPSTPGLPGSPIVPTIQTIFCASVNLQGFPAMSDAIECACFIAGVADATPFLGAIPAIDQVDCVCNLLTTAQQFCNNGSLSGFLYFLATIADCVSFALGIVFVNPWVDFGIDVVAAALQNLMLQGSVWPCSQWRACCRSASTIGTIINNLAQSLTMFDEFF